MIRVVIVDDERLVRSGFEALLASSRPQGRRAFRDESGTLAILQWTAVRSTLL